MRNANVTGSLVRFATDHPGLFWLDQDTLNVVLEGRWLELDPRWNAMNSLWTWTDWANDVFGETRVDAAKRNPAILHFEGPSICKPWHVLSTHAFKDAYRDALGRTPWPDTPLIGRSILTTLIGLLPERNRLPAYIKVRGSRGI
jgi:lipopolysaccharide biosynthesis glycosyltransferase